MTTHFEKQLEELHVLLMTMGELCEKAIFLSAKAVETQGEAGIVEEIFETDREIDQREREIEACGMRLLLRQHPVAGDLRQVSAALRMVSDMERIGDQAADIADISYYIEKDVRLPGKIQEMAEQTVKMVTESVEAFIKEDLSLCKKVIQEDDLVDEAFNQIRDELARLIYSAELDVKTGLDLLMTAKYFERIGDHAVNIAEWVEYSITGEHESHEHQPEL